MASSPLYKMYSVASSLTIFTFMLVVEGSLGHALPQSSIVGIAGGHPVDIADAPFMATLSEVMSTNETRFRCGGSIIHKQFVLTAAHCLLFRSDPLIVGVGSSQPSGGKLYEVDKYIMHELFHGKYKDAGYDVALLKLSEPLTFGSSVRVIEPADESFDIPVGLAANVTGWGLNENFEGWKRNLQQASVWVSPPSACTHNYYDVLIKISDQLQICIQNKARGFCSGDSGGPLTVGERQIGIVSGGSACDGYPNVYVKVASHLQWIRNKINENFY